MMNATPEKEHQWLHRLVGDWTYEMEAVMGPDQPPEKATGRETVRSLGGLWTIGEGTCPAPDGGTGNTVMTLGYNPQQKRFVGNFVASMMTHMWVYRGELSADGKTLNLDAEGPSFTDPGKMEMYRDSMEIVSDDHRILRSSTLGADGKWSTFMTAHYHRKK
jgi:hypothetical protein